MKKEPSSKKRGSLVLRMLLIISVVLVVIVLAGGLIVIKRMTSQPEPQPMPVAVRTKVPSPPPQAAKEGDLNRNESNEKTTEEPQTETGADSSEKAAELLVSESPEATPVEPIEVVAAKEAIQEKTADQKTSTPAEVKMETVQPPPAATDMPEEQRAPESRLAVKDAPEPAKASPGQGVAEPITSGESKQNEPSSPPSESQIRKGLVIQVASYRRKAFAETRMDELNQKGYNAFIYQTTDKDQRPWYVVRFGHFENRREADTFLVKFNKEEDAAAIVINQK